MSVQAANAMHDNLAVLRRMAQEVVNDGNYDVIDELFEAEAIIHAPTSPEPLRGREAAKHVVATMRTAFPDLTGGMQEVIADGERVWILASAGGTNTGEFMGLPATGRSAKWTAAQLFRLEGGRIVEWRMVIDRLALFQQLGFNTPGLAQR